MLSTLLSLSETAQARPTTEARPTDAYQLEWQAPPNCPSQLEISSQIQGILESAPGVSLPGELSAHGVVVPLGNRFELTLKVTVGGTELSRVIVSNDCPGLGKAAAVVLSLLIRRVNESGGSVSASDLSVDWADSRSAPPAEEPSSKAKPPPTPKPADRQAPADRMRFVAWAPLLEADHLTLPKTSLGVGLALGIQFGRWRVVTAGTLGSEQHLTRRVLEPYEATFSRSSIRLLGCRGWRASDLELSPCAVVSLERLRATASGDRFVSHPVNAAYLTLGAGLLGVWHLSKPVRVFLSTNGLISTAKTEFLVVGLGSTDNAHSVPRATVTTSLGLELVF